MELLLDDEGKESKNDDYTHCLQNDDSSGMTEEKKKKKDEERKENVKKYATHTTRYDNIESKKKKKMKINE